MQSVDRRVRGQSSEEVRTSGEATESSLASLAATWTRPLGEPFVGFWTLDDLYVNSCPRSLTQSNRSLLALFNASHKLSLFVHTSTKVGYRWKCETLHSMRRLVWQLVELEMSSAPSKCQLETRARRS